MFNILTIIKFSLIEQTKIRRLIIYSAVVGSSTLTMVWFIQPYLELINLPLQFFGIAWAAFNYSVGVFTYLARYVEQALGRRITLISLIILSGIGYFLLSYYTALWAALFIFIFYYIRGINAPLLKNYINQLITSDMRATVLSVQGLTGRLTFSLLGPFIGWAKDYYSMSTGFQLAGIIFVILGFVAVIFLGKSRAI